MEKGEDQMKQKMMTLVLMISLMVPCVAFAGNLADVVQVGDSNVAMAAQIGADNTATVSQYGRNLAEVDQNGNSNTATVKQGSEGSPVSNYYQPAFAADWKQGAYVDQDGNSNTASITMTNSGIGAKILQDGNSNDASQALGAASSYTNGNKLHMAIEIAQVGDNNKGLQITSPSYGSHGIQDMLIEQTGNSNTGAQTSIGGRSSVMNIIQGGNSNTSTQVQDGMFDKAVAKMIGDGNLTVQTQVSSVWGAATSHNSATIDIAGNTNTALQNQFGVSNSMDINIVGNGNSATQNQVGENNVAKLTQIGNNNMACQLQTGNGNSSTVTQTGNLNTAMVTQHN